MFAEFQDSKDDDVRYILYGLEITEFPSGLTYYS